MRLMDFTGVCVENGWLDWFDCHLLPLLEPADRKQAIPNDTDLLEEIQKMALEKHPSGVYTMVRYGGRRGITNERIITVLRQFSIKANSFKELNLLCVFLAEIGTRRDLDILDSISVAESTDLEKASQLKEGTRYLVRRKSLL
jgi:hypothetical protein